MQKQDNSGVIVAAVIGAFAVVLSALIGYFGLRAQVETPINATRTAVAEANRPTASAIYVTQVAPSFTVVNSLALAAEIYVEGASRGIVEKYSSKTFVLDTFPVRLSWIIVKQTVSGGNSIGDDMQGGWDSVSNQDVKTIDNMAAGQLYFYPLISNNTNLTCEVIINQGLEGEYRTGVIVDPNASAVGIGYYKLFTNSNVYLDCGDMHSWWGVKNGEVGAGGFLPEIVQPESGAIALVLNPR